MRNFPYQAANFRLLVAAILCGVGLTGCIIIPVDYHATCSRHNVTMESTNIVRIGETTREDVLLALGEPDFESEDGRRLGYLWSKVKAVWAVISYGSGAGGEIIRSYFIEASFDASNRVSAVRFLENSGETITDKPPNEAAR